MRMENGQTRVSHLSQDERVDFYIRLLEASARAHDKEKTRLRRELLREITDLRISLGHYQDLLRRVETDTPWLYFKLAFRALSRVCYKAVLKTMIKWRVLNEDLPSEYR